MSDIVCRYGGALVLCWNVVGCVPLAVSVLPASRIADPSCCVRPYNLLLVQSTIPVEGRLLPDRTLASRSRALHSSAHFPFTPTATRCTRCTRCTHCTRSTRVRPQSHALAFRGVRDATKSSLRAAGVNGGDA